MTDPSRQNTPAVLLPGWRRCRCGLCLYVWEEPVRAAPMDACPACGRTERLSEERRVR